jgi:DNA polymerase III subunit epsilon
MGAGELRYLVFFDAETTGKDPWWDRIVELAMLRVEVDGDGMFGGSPEEMLAELVALEPGMEISEEATAVHGITADQLEGCPRFRELAPRVQELVEGAVLVGYNCRRFDTILLHEELLRAGQDGLETSPEGRITHPEIDLYRLWQLLEPRTLEGAVRRFAGTELEGAHSAVADTEALVDVLNGLLSQLAPEHYVLTQRSVQSLTAMSAPEEELDRAGKFRLQDGQVLFAFGKHEGKPARSEPDYLRWMLGADFPEDSKGVARQELLAASGAFL